MTPEIILLNDQFEDTSKVRFSLSYGLNCLYQQGNQLSLVISLAYINSGSPEVPVGRSVRSGAYTCCLGTGQGATDSVARRTCRRRSHHSSHHNNRSHSSRRQTNGGETSAAGSGGLQTCHCCYHKRTGTTGEFK